MQKVHSSYHVRFLESHDGHLPPSPTDSESGESVEHNAEDKHTLRPLSPHDDDDDEQFTEHHPPNHDDQSITDTPPPKPPRHSSCIPIPTEKHTSGGPDISRTAVAVQASRESAAWVKEA